MNIAINPTVNTAALADRVLAALSPEAKEVGCSGYRNTLHLMLSSAEPGALGAALVRATARAVEDGEPAKAWSEHFSAELQAGVEGLSVLAARACSTLQRGCTDATSNLVAKVILPAYEELCEPA